MERVEECECMNVKVGYEPGEMLTSGGTQTRMFILSSIRFPEACSAHSFGGGFPKPNTCSPVYGF